MSKDLPITSYAEAVAYFSKARKPEGGRPLVRGWRIYKDGDEFTIYCIDKLVARILPDNTAMFVADQFRVRSAASYSLHLILPFILHRQGPSKYKVRHNRVPDSKTYVLFDDLTLDLATGGAVGPSKLRTVTDKYMRKEWLRMKKELTTYLHTVVKVGGFQSRMDALARANVARWTVGGFVKTPGTGSPATAVLLKAMQHMDYEECTALFAEQMYRVNIYGTPLTLQQQLDTIDVVINDYSTVLREALGAIKYVKE